MKTFSVDQDLFRLIVDAVNPPRADKLHYVWKNGKEYRYTAKRLRLSNDNQYNRATLVSELLVITDCEIRDFHEQIIFVCTNYEHAAILTMALENLLGVKPRDTD